MAPIKKKTSPVSFRIDSDILRKLRLESRNRQITSNALVNQALRGYVEWNRFEPISGLVATNKVVLKHVFEKLKQDEIIETGKIGAREIADTAAFMVGDMNLTSFLSWFEMRLINSSVHVNHLVKDSLHVYVIRHDIGYNWSLHQKIVLETILERLFNKKIQVKIDPSMISFQISL